MIAVACQKTFVWGVTQGVGEVPTESEAVPLGVYFPQIFSSINFLNSSIFQQERFEEGSF